MNVTGRILVVDDDEAICTVIREKLRRDGHNVKTAGSLSEMRQVFPEFDPELLVTDVMLPDGNGLDNLPSLIAGNTNMPVIVLSAQNTLSTAVRANEQGAFEYLPKPFDLDQLSRAVFDGLAARKRASAASPAAPSFGDDLPLIGRSAAMQEVYRIIARVVANELSVLILGESGTGKELVARAIHDLGPRAVKPFVAINMAAIPRELIESELFGHEKGAFTGATGRSAGKFGQAQGGTLFLDEIGDMPMDAQTRLLRVLQSGEYSPVGSAQTIATDVRIVAATHKHLPELIEKHLFREDLYYRLNVVPIHLPALRQRLEDIAELARHFLDKATREGLPRKHLSQDALAVLTDYSWPGNVRELENLMRRLAALVREETLTGAVINQYLRGTDRREETPVLLPNGQGLSAAVEQSLIAFFARFGDDLPPDGLYDRVLAEVELPLLRLTMAATKGNQLRAARLLGINRNTLRQKLRDHGLISGA
ncbi:nitrogen regulation protein NR(I) [Aquisediminimonas sediminicola]|uniref:nitrogen regulation protein NR(I) n=1 Tax=Alteraquisediminimonas sediminicola TaxID=2676787 RepID=UPI001C8EAC17|nr:nitrogen regulation protein NR(I) [Aquisediminimonas sediminicola]